MDESPQPGAPVVFRSNKRRKIYRQRAEDNDAPEVDASATPAVPAPTTSVEDKVPSTLIDADDEDQGLSVAEALRMRNARRPKHRGVEFRREGETQQRAGLTPEDGSLVLHEQQQLMGIDTRFAPQTGMVGEAVNKHMEEYVESALAKRYTGASTSQAPSATPTSRPPGLDAPQRRVPDGLPMMQGKLQEIDLGDEVRSRNIAMTERARRRLEGENVPDNEDDTGADKGKKVRLGPDGQPWRGRKRRGSEDVKRDQIVEDFLHENRLDIYEVPTHDNTAGQEDDELAGDDRIAEEFKQSFIDAMQARRSRRQPAINAPRQPPKSREAPGEVLKGPKLGGSRNQRAAMRDVLLAQQEATKKAPRR